MRKTTLFALLFIFALLLTGCGEQKKEEAPSPEPEAQETARPEAEGPLGEAARALLAPYEAELSQVSAKSAWNLTYTIPGDMIGQLARDADALGANPENGRYRFTRRQSGNYSYESSSDEALKDISPDDPALTPDPADETPMDSQLMGDYAVSGGGLFDRTRMYDAAENLTDGKIEIIDTLNGERTGHEAFSFALRGQDLYFVDAVLDMAVSTDSISIQNGYLAAVGVLRPDGLEIVEYRIDDLSQLPDPAAMDIKQVVSSVQALSHLTADGASVTAEP